MTQSKQVWLNPVDSTRPRTDWVTFRRTFALSVAPAEAEFRLFASSRYRLTVNSEILGYGPARFAPKYAEVAVYDLRKHLRPGANTILVEACFIDCNNYQHLPDRTGRFIAWGQIRSGNVTIDLATPGDWQACRIAAVEDAVPSYSFAIGPVEVRDERIKNSAWHAVDPIEPRIEDWKFSDPTIPPLSGTILRPTLRLVAPIVSDEIRIGFVSVHPTSRSSHIEPVRGQRFRYVTHLHSPHDQEITLGVHWGPHFLNGVTLDLKNDSKRGNRQNVTVKLHRGWNLLCGEPEQLQPSHPTLLGFPADAGITAHALPNLAVRETTAYQPARAIPEELSWAKAPPVRSEDTGVNRETWKFTQADTVPACPARMMSWDRVNSANAATAKDFSILAPTRVREWTCVFDAGSEYLGHVRIDLDAPSGTIVDIGYGEELRSDGAIAWFNRNHSLEMADRFICGGGRRVLETFHPRGGRFIQITIRAASDESLVTLNDVALVDARSSLKFDREFVSSNPLFEWVWKTGVKTLHASADDSFCDSPWRERGVYLGDSYIQSLVELETAKQPAIGRRVLRLFAACQRSDGQFPNVVPSWYDAPLGDFSLIYVIWLHDYWRQTNDRETVAACMSAVERLLTSSTWKVSKHSSLWDVPSVCNLFIDWGVHKPALAYEENGVLNAFRFRALQCAAALFRELTDHPRADELERQADEVRAAFNTRLWIDSLGRFAGGTANGVAIEQEIVHVNVLALAFGLVDERFEPRLIQYVLNRVQQNVERALAKPDTDDYIELYFLKYVLDALVRVDRHDVAKSVITEHLSVLQKHDARNLWECLRWGLQGRGSLCHSWSAGPLIYLAKFVNESEQATGRPAATIHAKTLIDRDH